MLNTLEIKNIVGCSYKIGAAFFSSTTHEVLKKAENSKRKKNRINDMNDIEL